ncbi:MAG: extracellular solute-binding protein [Chloroflexota bacterium]
MTDTLQWSVCAHDDATIELLKNMFQAQAPWKIDLEVVSIPWGEYKQELTQIAIHNSGKVDVSQAGAPLVNDLMAMNVLRPFSERDIAEVGGEKTFLPIAWQNCFFARDRTVWSIPVFSDPRAVIYWSDLLEKAGVDESLAFSSAEHFDRTLQQLQTGGVQYPWSLNLLDRFLCLQVASSWLWDAGVDFVSAKTGKSEFLSPAGFKGLKAYFDLKRYMDPGTIHMEWQEVHNLFPQRQAAVAIVNFGQARQWYQNAPKALRPFLKIATPLKQGYVGGSNLVIWASSHMSEMDVNLIKFLTSEEVQRFYPPTFGQLPVRQDILDDERFAASDPVVVGFINVLKNGRMYPNVKFGGLLEDQLTRAFDRIWHILFTEPSSTTEETLRRVLSPIARRYDNIAN